MSSATFFIKKTLLGDTAMNKLLVFLFFLSMPFIASAQFSQKSILGKKTAEVTGNYAIDDQQNIVVSKTIESIPSFDAAFAAAKYYLQEAYQETKYSIQIDNPEDGVVSGQGTYLNFFRKNIVPYTYYLDANITLRFDIDREKSSMTVSVLVKDYSGRMIGGNDEELIKDRIVNFAPINNANDTRKKTYSKAFPELVTRMNNTLNTAVNELNFDKFANVSLSSNSGNGNNAQQKKKVELAKRIPSSDVDLNIPESNKNNELYFAIIIANENYQEEVNVEYAHNDGEVFKTYCIKTLGIPEENIHFRKDATLNNFRAEITWMEKVADAYQGSAKFIVYYAGHGVPDEASGTSYLLPVDGKGSVLETGISLQNFYETLSNMPSSGVTVFMDACFSGSKRGDGMLASARGVAIKAKTEEPKGKIVVFSAAQGEETAYPFKKKEHGLFTYFLLKKLKESSGNCTLGELGDYLRTNVARNSIVNNGKSQTPVVSSSTEMKDTWSDIKFFE